MSLIPTRPGSLVDKIKLYLEANPDEELSMAIICLKFNCTYSAAKSAVERMKHTGHYEAVHVIRLRAKGIAKKEVA